MPLVETELPQAEAGLLRDTLDRCDLGLVWADEQGRIRHANRRFLEWSASAESVCECFTDLSPARWQSLREGHLASPLRLHLRLPDGGLKPVELRLRPVDDASLTALLLSPLDERFERESIDALQREVLEALALGRPLREVMDLLCGRVEALAPEVICTVLAVDAKGLLHPLAAPGLPPAFSAALEGAPIGPQAGSCGTAAWRCEPVDVQDIASDPLWDGYRPLAEAFGLAACWSTPILTAPAQVGATFALYYRERRPVATFHRRMVEACVQLCQIALKHEDHTRQIERLAYYDGVTGLANRSLLADRVQQALQMSTALGAPSALLLLDLDRFKSINDSLGHVSGDEVLRRVAQCFMTALRETDTLARLGGDEFVALLPGCNAVDAMHVADELQAALAAPLALDDQVSLPLSVSIGISTFPEDGSHFDSLLKNAELAMYEAKRAGRNCTRYFMPAMNQALAERMRMEGALRGALAGNALSLHYQPKLRLSDGHVVGVEALLRWTDAQLGVVTPDRFIPVAEDCGLINALDAWVLATACAQLASWRSAGLTVPSMAVNVSPLRFYQDDVAADVARLLVRHGLQAQDLTLEVTERLMLDDNLQAREQLRALDAMGVRLSVDDFGTGYSSLSYLKRLPVSELKLDQSFVRDLEHDAEDRALASAVIGIGRALGLAVVAEGVETEGQRRVLLEAGCEAAQGYLFARPQAAADFEAWFRAGGR